MYLQHTDEFAVLFPKIRRRDSHPKSDQKVQQAAANLLDNALKHTPEKGSVTLVARPHFWERRVVEASPTQERRRFRLPRPNSVEVSVADSGPGIAAGEHARIFERFFTSASPHTAMQSGAGLGLSITKLIVDRSEGEVFFEDRASNQGARCCIILPIESLN